MGGDLRDLLGADAVLHGHRGRRDRRRQRPRRRQRRRLLELDRSRCRCWSARCSSPAAPTSPAVFLVGDARRAGDGGAGATTSPAARWSPPWSPALSPSPASSPSTPKPATSSTASPTRACRWSIVSALCGLGACWLSAARRPSPGAAPARRRRGRRRDLGLGRRPVPLPAADLAEDQPGRRARPDARRRSSSSSPSPRSSSCPRSASSTGSPRRNCWRSSTEPLTGADGAARGPLRHRRHPAASPAAPAAVAWQRAFRGAPRGRSRTSPSTPHAGMTDPEIAEIVFREVIGREGSEAERAEAIAGYLGHLADAVAESERLPGDAGDRGAAAAAGRRRASCSASSPATSRRPPTSSSPAATSTASSAFGGYGSDSARPHRADQEGARARRAGLRRARSTTAPAIAVGDTPRDVRAGHGAGIKVVGVATGSYSVEELPTPAPTGRSRPSSPASRS